MYLLILVYFSLGNFFLFETRNLPIYDIFFIITMAAYFFSYKKKIIFIFKEFRLVLYFIIIIFSLFVIIDKDLGYFYQFLRVLYYPVYILLNISLYIRNKEEYKKILNYSFVINIAFNLINYLGSVGFIRNIELFNFEKSNQLTLYFTLVILLSDFFDLKNKVIIKIFSVFLILNFKFEYILFIYFVYEIFGFVKIKKIVLRKPISNLRFCYNKVG